MRAAAIPGTLRRNQIRRVPPVLQSLDSHAPHFVLEAAAYALGARMYWRGAKSPMGLAATGRLAILAGAILGALVGSKLLHLAEHLPSLLEAHDLSLWIGGKSLLGGLLGGTIGVELAKRGVGWSRPTGDAWVIPLAIGIAIGRIGCQLSGYWDLTYGIPTSLPWAWDYGDGVGRHPTALYEAIAVAMLGLALQRWQAPAGARFAAFLLGYCVLRLALECLKPPFGPAGPGTLPVALYAGLTAIQWTALAGIAYSSALLARRMKSTVHA